MTQHGTHGRVINKVTSWGNNTASTQQCPAERTCMMVFGTAVLSPKWLTASTKRLCNCGVQARRGRLPGAPPSGPPPVVAAPPSSTPLCSSLSPAPSCEATRPRLARPAAGAASPGKSAPAGWNPGSQNVQPPPAAQYLRPAARAGTICAHLSVLPAARRVNRAGGHAGGARRPCATRQDECRGGFGRTNAELTRLTEPLTANAPPRPACLVAARRRDVSLAGCSCCAPYEGLRASGGSREEGPPYWACPCPPGPLPLEPLPSLERLTASFAATRRASSRPKQRSKSCGMSLVCSGTSSSALSAPVLAIVFLSTSTVVSG